MGLGVRSIIIIGYCIIYVHRYRGTNFYRHVLAYSTYGRTPHMVQIHALIADQVIMRCHGFISSSCTPTAPSVLCMSSSGVYLQWLALLFNKAVSIPFV